LNPADDDAGMHKIRLVLPTIRPRKPGAAVNIPTISVGRPEFYDFDLFGSAGTGTAADNRALNELVYTVFDTETTGLDPRGGDEIISIGAVRIVNQRILQADRFDQLVDPQRDVPWESVKVHGIQPGMLVGQPRITNVLPDFHRFVQDTILVGHNVAFDMAMLEMKQAQTGVIFEHAILDTMLLSTVIHPSHKDHSMEKIAGRLGVAVAGRHTAVGDAVATAELFLKMIPLLNAMGIRTLGEAISASRKSYYARLKY
jgi:DNA polymerase-3 subunit epsilon